MMYSNQRGYVRPRGKKWYGYFRKTVINPITKQKMNVRAPHVILGLRSKMTKGQARAALDLEMTTQGVRPGPKGRIMQDGSMSFAWFVRNRYLPLKKADWSEETAKNKTFLIQQNLVDDLGEIPLNNFDKFTLQTQVNKLATTRPKDTVLQMRAYVRDIFSEAADQDFLTKDPSLKVKVPARLRATDTTTLTWDQLRAALDDMESHDRVCLELDITNALRPSELFALRWRRWDAANLKMNIVETVYKGKIRPWGKTQLSLSSIHVPAELGADIEKWRAACPDSSADAFIFPTREGGFQDTDNYRKRVLHSLAERLGLPKLTFQVIRRTVATLAQHLGSVKDVQGLLRHMRAPTTTDKYMQVIPEGVASTLNSISSQLRGKKAAVKSSRAATKSKRESSRISKAKAMARN
jgi:integrase